MRPATDTGTKRKVYSPYGSNRAGFTIDEDGEIKDGLNRFGDFLADSVDSILWGPEEFEEVVVDEEGEGGVTVVVGFCFGGGVDEFPIFNRGRSPGSGEEEVKLRL